jgi:hypothetical protein
MPLPIVPAPTTAVWWRDMGLGTDI